MAVSRDSHPARLSAGRVARLTRFKIVGRVSTMARCLFILSLAMLWSSSASRAASMTDAELTKLLHDAVSPPMFAMQIGDLTVVPDCDGACKTGSIRIDRYHAVHRRLARGGIVSITGEADHAGGRIRVVPSAEAKKRDVSEIASLLVIPRGSYDVAEIVQNRPVRLGSEEGRLVLARYSFVPDPYYAHIAQAIGEKAYPDRKARILFEHDPFKRTWKLNSADFADLDEDFRSNNVDEEIAKRGSMR